MKLTRRKFVSISVKSISPLLLASPFRYEKDRQKPLRAAVIEYAQTETKKAIGAEILLRKAGFDVVSLHTGPLSEDLSPSSMVLHYADKAQHKRIEEREKKASYSFAVKPDINEIDLLFFGSFANQHQIYHDYIRLYAQEIQAFVRQGGIVVEMNQWARYGFLHPTYLPEGLSFNRESWSGTDDLYLMDKDHPFIRQWIGQNEGLLQYPKQPHREERYFEGRRSWESLIEWQGLRVLIGAGAGYLPGGRAALLEGVHGKGRYLFSSLWLDKLYDQEGNALAAPQTMQAGARFFRSLYQYVQANKQGNLTVLSATANPPEPIIGPMLGHIDHQQAYIWLRGNHPTTYILSLWKEGTDPSKARHMDLQADPARDFCIHWQLTGLEPDSSYLYRIEAKGRSIGPEAPYHFHTAISPDLPSSISLAFGSCVDQEGRFSALWQQIADQGVEGMVLLGDTPYIDSTVTEQQRVKHRYFLSQKGPAELAKKIPFWATWDDHDFGANASDGTIHNSDRTRQVFMDYRALPQYGEEEEGIYMRFRRGPLDVFLLDTRYFSGKEASFADPSRPTLIGTRQWEWLKKNLKASTAPFKLLVCGMTWDAKIGTGETDDWYTYVYEREAIIDYIGQERISGVLLIGGDIHCTQVMKLPTENRIGYPLYHIVTSPMHERIIPEQEQLKHPGMLFVKAEPNTFLKIDASNANEPATLTAEIWNLAKQCIYRLNLNAEELQTAL